MADNNKVEGNDESSRGWISHSLSPVRQAIFRGLAVIMPPLLTIVLFVWAWNLIEGYVLVPIEATLRYGIVLCVSDIRDEKEINQEMAALDNASQRIAKDGDTTVYLTSDGPFVKVNKSYIPKEVFDRVQQDPGEVRPTTPRAYYHRYVRLRYLQRQYIIPLFVALFIIVLYVVGKLFAAGLGRMAWSYFEAMINRIPIIRNVYSSVKQVTDFAFSESEIQFTRVVAIQYPRKGIWSMGFVTGESFMDIRTAANEPVLSVLMPTSPMPATGFTVTVPKSETIDLNITIDQAIQFCVSCGVVVPQHQQSRNTIDAKSVARTIESQISEAVAGQDSDDPLSRNDNLDGTV
jgi:uncharacterized membrane protein